MMLYVLLLAVLAGVIWQFPFLWELAILAAIGGIYWIFFKSPSAEL